MLCVRPSCCGVAIGKRKPAAVAAYTLSLLGVLVFIFCCCVTNCCKLSGLKQHTSISSWFCVSEVWVQCGWVFYSGYHKAEIKLSYGLSSCLEDLPKLTSKAQIVSRTHFFAVCDWEPISLLVVGQGLLLAPCMWTPPSSKERRCPWSFLCFRSQSSRSANSHRKLSACKGARLVRWGTPR